jgi:hypothetical protein
VLHEMRGKPLDECKMGYVINNRNAPAKEPMLGSVQHLRERKAANVPYPLFGKSTSRALLRP